MKSRPKKRAVPLAPISCVRERVVELGVGRWPGRVSIYPGTVVAAKIQEALQASAVPDVIVYDAKGRPVKRLDGLTHREKPLGRVKRIQL